MQRRSARRPRSRFPDFWAGWPSACGICRRAASLKF
jgi:hypothetical protein